ncbi:MAG: Gfo/Idh/MocA family oxidoreductase [Chloroflexi bacterium]|nr:Gfo/Idh/MocA family oxidoreductase [Chloroflexota bacterium]
MQVRIGVIGLGMGRYHLKEYQSNPSVSIVAICDQNEPLLAEYQTLYPQAKAYTSYEELLAAGGLDGVSVALPNFLHAQVTIAALRAGCNVLCEKPMALNAAQAAEMLRTSQETDKKLMIHFNYRFSPPSRFLKRYVDEGHLGQIYYAKTHWLRANGIPKLGGWFGIKELSGGGPLIDLGVHRLDLAMWLMGYPKAKAVSAYTSGLLGARIARDAGAKYDCEDLTAALIRLENGTVINLEVSFAGGTDKDQDMVTGIYGTNGAAIQRNRGEGYEFEAVALQNIAGALSQVNPKYFERCPSAIEHFVNCIIKDCQPEASAENGLEMMRIIDAIYRSAAEGREVTV